MIRFQPDLIPAMLTPFTADGSALDLPAMEALATYLIDNGCDGLLVNGTTGESPTLTANEQAQLFQVVQAVAKTKNIPVMMGVGSNSTQKTIKNAEAAVKLGAEALLVVVPYYNKPSQEGQFQHFKAVALAVPETEIVIYNIPGRCGVEMTPETMVRLKAVCPNIIGVKQSVASLETLSAITYQFRHEDWLTWSGDDPLTLPMMACGAHGVVSVLAHLTPQPLRRMIQCFKAGDLAQAREIHGSLLSLAQGLFKLPNPTITKTLMAEMGYLSPALRLPMVPPSPEERAIILCLMAEVELANTQYPLSNLLASG